MHWNKRSNMSAFTLLELLVVVAIIVILLVILLPGLDKALKYAETAKCAANEGSIAKAMVLYLHDARQKYPVLNNYNGLLGNLGNTTVMGADHHGAWDRPLNKYLGYNFQKNVDTPVPVAECPSDAGDSFLGFDSAFQAVGVSYMPQMAYDDFRAKHVFGWNGHGQAPLEQITAPLPPDARSSARQSSFIRPSNKIILADWPWHGDRLYSDPRTQWHDASRRKFNTLFADAHVEFFFFDPKKIEKDGSSDANDNWMTAYNPSFQWW